MGKLSNMIYMIDLLNTGNIYTLKELSERIGVTERMIRYYKNEICNNGIAIESFKGPNGGYFMIDKIKNYDAIDTVIPATDTIVEVDDDIISNIPIRSKMFQGQTPQTFRLKELVSIYNSLSNEEKEILTDACKIYTLKNKRVGYVKGEIYNLKITTKFDLNVAHSIVKGDIKI